MTAVDTSPDLRHARVYVSVLGDEEERSETLAGLESSRGYLQAAIGSELRLKHTPMLQFEHDETLERGVRISRLLEELVEDEDHEGEDDGGGEAQSG